MGFSVLLRMFQAYLIRKKRCQRHRKENAVGEQHQHGHTQCPVPAHVLLLSPGNQLGETQ